MNDYHCDLIISGGLCLAFNKKEKEITLLKDAKHVGIMREIKYKNNYMHLVLNGGWATQCKCTKTMRKWITQETRWWTRRLIGPDQGNRKINGKSWVKTQSEAPSEAPSEARNNKKTKGNKRTKRKQKKSN